MADKILRNSSASFKSWVNADSNLMFKSLRSFNHNTDSLASFLEILSLNLKSLSSSFSLASI